MKRKNPKCLWGKMMHKNTVRVFSRVPERMLFSSHTKRLRAENFVLYWIICWGPCPYKSVGTDIHQETMESLKWSTSKLHWKWKQTTSWTASQFLLSWEPWCSVAKKNSSWNQILWGRRSRCICDSATTGQLKQLQARVKPVKTCAAASGPAQCWGAICNKFYLLK